MKVLVADDHEFVRGGLVSQLSEIIPNPFFLEASNATEVRGVLEKNNNINLAVMDLYMPGSNRYELISWMCQTYPDLRVVILTASNDHHDMRDAVKVGAVGYISKIQGKDIVRHALGLVLSGGTYFPKNVPSHDLSIAELPLNSKAYRKNILLLTQRQKEVLTFLLQGKTNKLIAEQLKISQNTVKVHVTAILRILKLKSRSQIIARLRG